jgi:hypothetical protein
LVSTDNLLKNVSHPSIPTSCCRSVAGWSRFREQRLFSVELHCQDDIEQIVPRPDEEVRIPEEVDSDWLLVQLLITVLLYRVLVGTVNVEPHNIGLLRGVIPEDVQMLLEIRDERMLNTNPGYSDIRPLLSLERSI